jgi:hypothetical protein
VRGPTRGYGVQGPAARNVETTDFSTTEFSTTGFSSTDFSTTDFAASGLPSARTVIVPRPIVSGLPYGPNMMWTTPEVQRPDPQFTADERTALTCSLDHQRLTFLWKCGGLTAEQLTLRPFGRSTLSLLGLARHLADVERWWARRHFAGDTDAGWIFFDEDDMEGDFLRGTAESAPGDFETLRAEMAAARTATAGRALDDTFRRPDGEPADLRWLLLHLIEEYARHNGHADLLREHIDGRTGD